MPEAQHIPNQAKEANERRSVIMPIRWKPSEITRVNQLATTAKADVSEYVRASALNKPPKVITRATGDRRVLIQLLGELGKVGSNVNQLARAFNQGNQVEVAAIIHTLQAIEQCADAIRFTLQNPEP